MRTAANRTLLVSLLLFLGVFGFRGVAAGGRELSTAVPTGISAWRNGSLQRAVEERVGFRIALHAPLGPAYSQVLWSALQSTPAKRQLVVGRDRQLYEELSVREYCRPWESLATSDSDIEQFAAQTATLNNRLRDFGRAFVVLATPSKAATHPEHIPRLLCAGGEAANRIAPRLSRALRGANVPLVDGPTLTREAASRASVPVFAHYGIHWTRWGAYPATAALLRIGAEQLGDLTPNLDVSNVTLQPESVESSNDRAMLMDLYWGTREERVPIVRFVLTPPDGARRRATFVGGSFLHAVIGILQSVGAYASIEEFNYLTLFHASHPSGSHRDNLRVDDIDWEHDIFTSDVVVLEINEENGIPDHARLFVSESLRRLTGTAPRGGPAPSLEIRKPHVVDP